VVRSIALGILGACLLACDLPIILETSASACRNGMDDDGDGDADCEDVDCVATTACEATAAACANGRDDDDDGSTDCTDVVCLALEATPCVRTEVVCDVATGAGCLQGMTCALDNTAPGEVRTFCQNAGTRAAGDACEADEECAVGLTCPFGFCTAGCHEDADCPSDARCLRGSSVGGACTTPCTPYDASEACAGETCVSLHAISFAFDEGGASFTCIASEIAAGFAGTGVEGATCALRVTPGTTPTSQICAVGLTCALEVDASPVCRRGCSAVYGSPGFGCEPPLTCIPSYPADPRIVDGQLVPGTCECDPGTAGCP
jgi:hypothetical protein